MDLLNTHGFGILYLICSVVRVIFEVGLKGLIQVCGSLNQLALPPIEESSSPSSLVMTSNYLFN